MEAASHASSTSWLLTSLVFSVVGLVVMGWALARWIEEIRHG